MLLGIVGPMISGWFLMNIMGVADTPTDPASIRPLFYISLAISVVSLFLIIFKLENIKWGKAVTKKRHIMRDAVSILKADKNCRKWVVCASVGALPTGMVIPYLQVFAAEYKNADTPTLAAITTATALTSVLCGYFVGILSDKFGRKKIFLATIICYIVGLAVLLVGNSPVLLVFVGLMAGFQEISAPVSAAIQNELVPRSVMGRWQGVVRFFSGIISAVLALVAGVAYDVLGGQWVFIIYIACEVCIRIPLLLSLPETLHYKVNEESFAALND